jgi:hypothetical protein
MKAEILKIAKVKDEKSFYKKYPSEEAFMKVHGKEFKKAQIGASLNNAGNINSFNPINLQEYIDDSDKLITGSTDAERRAIQLAQQENAPQQSEASGSEGGGLSSIMSMLGGGGEGGSEGGGEMSGMLSSLGGARYGTNIPRAQQGGSWQGSMFNQPGIPQEGYTPGTISLNDDQLQNQGGQYDGYAFQGGPNTGGKQGGGGGFMDAVGKYAGPVGNLASGYQALRGERRARKAAEQNLAISNVTRQASETEDVDKNTQRKYMRPEDNINSGSAFFPVYGVGTNVLARNGVRLQDGGGIGGNPTEIQNTYSNGYDIYTDGGYEPLTNPNQVKSFYHGGRLHNMQDGGGMSPDMYGQIGSTATGLGQSFMGGQNAGGQIGGTIGQTAGTAIGGPVGGMIGQFAGGMIGNALDTNSKKMKKAQEATQRNIIAMSLGSAAKGLQGQNQSYMKDGGYMNPEYNPQVITMFGDHDSQDFADYAHKDQYRAGGHLKSYNPPSERAMETYEDGGGIKSYGLGGELQTHWGGGAETLSHNPYLPGTGETVMFRGKSHEERSPNGETGIGVTYGGNPVEVERGEPMVELEEGGTVDPQTGEVQKSGVVFGNLKIPNQYIDMLGDKSAKGKKFKNYVADLSKTEAKQNKLIEKSTNELNGFTPLTSFDKLKMTALQANIQGANMKLKDIADKKINAASLQNAINDTAEENGLVADDLARGKVKIDKEAMQTREARWGDAISKAAEGKTVTTDTTSPPTSFTSDADAIAKGYKWTGKYLADGKTKEYKRTIKKFSNKESEQKSAEALKEIPKGQKYDPSTGLHGKVTPQAFEETKKANSWFNWSGFDPKNKADVKRYQEAFNAKAKEVGSSAYVKPDSDFGEQTVSARLNLAKQSEPIQTEEELTAIVPAAETSSVETKNKYPWWMGYANQAMKYLRPSDQEELDAAQLYPEMYALATNQLEPVPAQGFQPDLSIPYDISFQDQLNANQADYRATQRMVGYNPAAQAQLNAQKYQANQGVLGEQFRANQAMKDKVYGENRNILNDSKLKNLEIFDRQYGRQAEALSNTKATTQAALNSISDKYAKNKLENKTLGIYENMYNYRFGKDNRADNWNPLQFFDTEAGGAKAKGNQDIAGLEATRWDKNGTPIAWKKATDKSDDSSDDALEAVGGIKNKNGSSIKKNHKNSSVVRAYKNL